MSQCDTCAFGNSGAAKEANNALKGKICALGAIPFWCHHGKDGTEYDWQNSKLGPYELEQSNRKICAGWQAEVAKLKRRGFFDEFRAIRRAAARVAFRSLEIFIDKTVSLHKKERARVMLERCLKFLVKRDIRHEELPF